MQDWQFKIARDGYMYELWDAELFYENEIQRKSSYHNAVTHLGEDPRNIQLLVWVDDLVTNNRVNRYVATYTCFLTINRKRSKQFRLKVCPANAPRWFRANEKNWMTIFSIPRAAIVSVHYYMRRYVVIVESKICESLGHKLKTTRVIFKSSRSWLGQDLAEQFTSDS
jgi:hypothetical protein